MLAYAKEGQSNRDWMQEFLARIGNPLDTKIEGWYDISSAPLDGTPCEVRDGKWQPFIARFVGGYWRFDAQVYFQPTLWRPVE